MPKKAVGRDWLMRYEHYREGKLRKGRERAWGLGAPDGREHWVPTLVLTETGFRRMGGVNMATPEHSIA